MQDSFAKMATVVAKSRNHANALSEMKISEDQLKTILADFGCETGTIHRAKGEWLHLVQSVDVPEFLLDKVRKIPFGKGIAGVAAETRAPVELCNLQRNLGGIAKADAKKTGVSGSLAVPIFSAGDEAVIGVLGIGKAEPYAFTNEEKARLEEEGSKLRAHLEA